MIKKPFKETLLKKMDSASKKVDVIITSGGASAGQEDYISKIMISIRNSPDIWQIMWQTICATVNAKICAEIGAENGVKYYRNFEKIIFFKVCVSKVLQSCFT